MIERLLEIPPDTARLGEVRELVDGAALDAGFGERERFQIRLAVSEAVTNAIRHGSPDAERDRIEVRCRAEQGGLAVYVRDRGRFGPRGDSYARSGIGGRGLAFMGTLMDEVDVRIEDSGTVLRLAKRPGQARADS